MTETSPELGSTRWRFTGAYPCVYYNHWNVSGWVNPGDVIEWPEGPPDANWERVGPEADATPVASELAENTEG